MTNATMTCQHCGDPVPNARCKQCTTCRDRKNDANKYGNYGATLQRMDEAKALGLTGQAFHNYVSEAAISAVERQRAADAQAKIDLERQQREHQQRVDERNRQNAFLKEHGYHWQKYEVGTEDDHMPGSYGAGYGEFSHYAWELVAPDGRAVTVAEALDEIERGMEVVKAERVARGLALQAQSEAERQTEEQGQAAWAEVWSAAQSLVEVEPFDTGDLKTVAAQRRGTSSDAILRGTWNGVAVAVTERGYSDGPSAVRYWCADPQSAGLIPAVRDARDQAFAEIFG